MTFPARRSASLLSASAALIIVFVGLAHETSISAQDATRGAALLALAQQAVGGAKPLAAVKSLQVTGKFRRVLGGNDIEGDFDVFIELPDKYLRSEKTGTPGQPSIETIEALVGTEARDATRGGRPAGGGRGNTTGGDAPADANDDAGGGQDTQPDVPAPDAPASVGDQPTAAVGRGRGGVPDPEALRRLRQAEVSRFLLMWLLKTDTPLAWVGTAQSPDGTADVLEVRYADAQPTRLFLETKTHDPLMLQWTAVPGQIAGAAGRRGGGGRRGAGADGGGAARQGGGPPQPTVFDMTFSDYRAVNGIRFPHVITRGSNGQTTERWTISRYRVNPSFNPETFAR